MKFNFKKILSLVLAAFVAFGTLGLGTLGANAASEDWRIGIDSSIWTGTSYYINVYDMNSTDPATSIGTVTNATSSNNGVFKISKDNFDNGGASFFVDPVKSGTAKLTVNFTTSTDETKTLSKNIVVKKYPKHIKSLRVNGKKVSTVKNKFYYSKKVSKSKTSVKVKMALKKGWKITKVEATYFTKKGTPKDFKVSKSAIKKGKAIKFGKKYKEMNIYVQMKKGSNTIWYGFWFFRK